LNLKISKSKIAILTTVVNFDLYRKTSSFFPGTIKRYVLDGRNRMYGLDSIVYMISKFKDLDIEWLIMADEDVIFYEPNEIYSIIENMNRNNITVCGVRDGGIIKHRNHNPHVINTFFSVLHLKEVLKIWNKKEMLNQQFVIPNEFEEDLDLPYAYDTNSLFEHYYCFYLWLRRKKKKFLFLNVKMKPDGIANDVIFNNITILCHTWYARLYGKNKAQTDRIDKYLPESNSKYLEAPIVFKDRYYFIKWRLNFLKVKAIKLLKNHI